MQILFQWAAIFVVLEIPLMFCGWLLAAPSPSVSKMEQTCFYRVPPCNAENRDYGRFPEVLFQKRENPQLAQNIALRVIGQTDSVASPQEGGEQHTLGHVSCPACERARIEKMDSGQFAEMNFSAAAEIWLQSKIGRKAERTTDNDAYHVRCLARFFGHMRLKDIHAGHLITYQQWRPSASKRKAGPSCINHELSVLQQILKRAGRWNEIQQWYSPLPLPKKGPGRALEPNEEEHLFAIASSDTRWKVAYCSLILTNNTTAGPGEIRKLRISDVDQHAWIITIREGAKNDDRVRHIPLNGEAQWAMQELLRLAKRKGATSPDHYLLPHRGKGTGGDPTRPMHSWKKAWYSLRTRAAEDMPSLSTLRPYDLRHHAITRLLENPDISEQTVKDIAGHVSKHILERYSHIRMAKKRDALDALCKKPMTVVKKEDSADSPKSASS